MADEPAQVDRLGPVATLRRERRPSFPDPERFLTLLVEGAALGVPEIDCDCYEPFARCVGKLARQLPDRLPDEEKLAQIRSVIARVRKLSQIREEELRNRTTEWRSLVSFLFSELLKSLGIDPSAGERR